MIAARSWYYTTLAELFGVGQADENDLHAALGWLLAPQDVIERYLHEGARVL
jgi:hypothetical protein